MFQVTTVNLSSDTLSASPNLGSADLGDLSVEEMTALLERFSQLDPQQNEDAEPHLLVTARAGRFVIRTDQGKLFLRNARDVSEPFASQLPIPELIAYIDRELTSPPFAVTSGSGNPLSAAANAKATPHTGIAVAILAAGLSLNGYTLFSVFYRQSVNEKTAVTLLTDQAELNAQKQSVVGTYATGNQAGDRIIVVGNDGKVSFSEIGGAGSLNEGSDSYQIGRHDRRLCLSTVGSGIVDILNIDTLIYFRDTYRRTK